MSTIVHTEKPEKLIDRIIHVQLENCTKDKVIDVVSGAMEAINERAFANIELTIDQQISE